MKLIKGKKYEISWVDIVHSNEWVSFDDIDKEIEESSRPIIILGNFIKETNDVYVFSSGLDESLKQYFDLVIIPKGVVRKIKKI